MIQNIPSIPDISDNTDITVTADVHSCSSTSKSLQPILFQTYQTPQIFCTHFNQYRHFFNPKVFDDKPETVQTSETSEMSKTLNRSNWSVLRFLAPSMLEPPNRTDSQYFSDVSISPDTSNFSQIIQIFQAS